MTAAKAPLWLWLLGLVAIALAQEKPEGALATEKNGCTFSPPFASSWSNYSRFISEIILLGKLMLVNIL